MTQKKELVFVLQGYYSCGWEDLCTYSCGVRQKEYKKASKECKEDFIAYQVNEPQYLHRIIKRYETL